MSDVIYLKTGQFSNRSFNATQKELKKAADALNILDDHGAMSNTTYTCDGISRPIFSEATIVDAAAAATLVNQLYDKLEAYSSLLQSGPDALRDADSSFKGEYTNAWQRGWYSISSGVSSVYVNTVGFWGALFRKDGKKTDGKTKVQDDSISGNKTDNEAVEEKEDERIPPNQEPEEKQNSTQVCEVIISPFSDSNGARKGVKEGEVRYVDQSYGNERANGWENYADTANWSCLTACISMALSYLGIDMSPADLLNAHNGERYWTGFYSGEKDVPGSINYTTDHGSAKNTLDTMMENLKNGGYSPIVLHYHSDLGEHTLLVTGQNADGSYSVIDPWNYQGIKRISISESGQLISDQGYSISHDRDENNNPHAMYIDGIWQYTK